MHPCYVSRSAVFHLSASMEPARCPRTSEHRRGFCVCIGCFGCFDRIWRSAGTRTESFCFCSPVWGRRCECDSQDVHGCLMRIMTRDRARSSSPRRTSRDSHGQPASPGGRIRLSRRAQEAGRSVTRRARYGRAKAAHWERDPRLDWLETLGVSSRRPRPLLLPYKIPWRPRI
ncbi:hypothetical protein K466DRAFT_340573 [Polyporus arcularius HHB13444]|uniref:Uncharacterized protein n=1 Tax=Polyporus arcularius HHB13444 TaxID=1314778 RepID=A0A5C3PNN0_9APHY|nr:hypothetical protein K466DRAFT_340573 [Polyporus arcularius HHB13444]